MKATCNNCALRDTSKCYAIEFKSACRKWKPIITNKGEKSLIPDSIKTTMNDIVRSMGGEDII